MGSCACCWREQDVFVTSMRTAEVHACRFRCTLHACAEPPEFPPGPAGEVGYGTAGEGVAATEDAERKAAVEQALRAQPHMQGDTIAVRLHARPCPAMPFTGSENLLDCAGQQADHLDSMHASIDRLLAPAPCMANFVSQSPHHLVSIRMPPCDMVHMVALL